MTIFVEITSVANAGDHLVVRGQGAGTASASWRPLEVVELRIAPTARNKRAFAVGKIAVVDFRPTKRKAG